MLAISNTLTVLLLQRRLPHRPYPGISVPLILAAWHVTSAWCCVPCPRASHLHHRHVPTHIRQRLDRQHHERGSGGCHGDRHDVSECPHHFSPAPSRIRDPRH